MADGYNKQLPITNYQLTITNYQLPITNYQFTTMADESNLFWFGCTLLGFSILIIFNLLSYKTKAVDEEKIKLVSEAEELRLECLRLTKELQQQEVQLKADFRYKTFAQLQTLLTTYPSIRKRAEANADFPAKNLVSILTPLDNVLTAWGYEQIGAAWEQVPYNPRLHQPDASDIAVGEMVYVRFVGYKEGDRILYPAKVSRTLPVPPSPPKLPQL
jgi:molecular chaperone GrpE (heat shock protein)